MIVAAKGSTVYVPIYIGTTGITAPTVTAIINNGNWAALHSGTWTEPTTANGWYTVTLDSTDTGAAGQIVVRVVKSGYDDAWNTVSILDPGTLQTGDAYAYLTTNLGALGANLSTLVTNIWGAGTRTLSAFSFTVAANLTQILGTALTETAGYLAAGFKQFFNIASPTSTMNTITTVTTATTATNLTNAPTAGDFTSTMKTALNAATPASVTGAVGSVTGAVGSVTGNVGGNVTGSVGSVVGAVGSVTAAVTTTDSSNVTAIKTKTDNLPASPAAVGSAMTLTSAYDAAKTAAQAGNQMDLVNAPNATALTAIGTSVWAAGTRTLTSFGTLISDIWSYATRTITSGGITVNQIWDELLSSHTTAGTAGKALSSAASGGAPSAATVASAVWEEPLSGHTTAGTAGKTLSLAGAGGIDNAALAAAILDEPIGTPSSGTIGQAIAEGALNAGTGQYLKIPDSLVDAPGNPIEGASVFVTADVVGTGTRIRDGQTTDSSGNIPGYWLNPGTYYWHAVKPGWSFPGVEFIVP